MPDDSQDTLARLLERLGRLDRERERILIAIQVIKNEDGGGDDPGLPASGAAVGDQPIPNHPTMPPPRRMDIRPDSFFGLSQHQAARRYLQSLGHADRLENIVRAVTAGGVEIGGANPTNTLRAILARNSSVFVKVSPGTFGLREFYGPRVSKSEPPGRSKQGKKRKKKPKSTKPRSNAAKPVKVNASEPQTQS